MKTNKFSKVVTRLLVRLVVTDIGCFLISLFIFAISENSALRAVVQIVDFIVVISVTYPLLYSVGNVDSPMINAGSREYKPLKGLFIGLCATTPWILTGAFLIISKLFGIVENFVNYYKILNAFYFPFCYSVMPTDYTISEIAWHNVLFSVLLLAIIPIICMFAYILGTRRFSFGEKVLYKKASKN